MSKKTLKNHQQETRLFSRRCVVIFSCILLFFIAIVVRLIYLQVMKEQAYTTLSIHNQLKMIPIQPTRGLIYDRNGILLAKNIPVFSLAVIPGEVKDVHATVEALSKLIDLKQTDIDAFNHALTQHRRYEPVPLKYKLTETERDQFYVNHYRFPGVIIQANMLREYPLGNLLSNVLGYVGRINARELAKVASPNYRPSDYIGKTGIEKYYEQELHGSVGYSISETNASGAILRNLKEIPQTPGNNLYLTIDSKLQAYALKMLGDSNGAVVAIEPKTGQILAMVTKPNYDPNPFVMGISQKDYQALSTDQNHPLYDRAVRGLYSPGSTIKPFQSITGLESKVITPNYTIEDPGWYRVAGTKHKFHDDRRSGHGSVDLHKAIRLSCDTYFYNLAVMLGIKRIDDFLPMFGFGVKTNVELPDEVAGVLPTPAWKRRHQGTPWYTGDTVNIGIGQGMMLATPLQLAHAVSIIAMRGQRNQPHLTLAWHKPDDSISEPENTTLPPLILSDKNYWQEVISGMESVIDAGTARRYGSHSGYKVAGKTGTAQVYGTYYDDETTDWQRPLRLRNNHLFINFAPVKEPKIALAVVVEHASLADKIAGRITRFYLHELRKKRLQKHEKQTTVT